jgi:uncharacterized protein (DUF697 family)
MPGLRDIAAIWNNIGELDLRPLREAALRIVRIAIVGRPGSGRHTLAAQLRTDPARPSAQTQTPILITEPDLLEGVAMADLIILVCDATQTEFTVEQALMRKWSDAGKKLIVFCNKLDLLEPGQIVSQWAGRAMGLILYGSAQDTKYLTQHLVPAVLSLLPDRWLALARQYPLFRQAVAQDMLNDACIANAAYSLSTGLAEMVPALDIPLNVTDMIVLTKNQAFLAYKMGLALGLSTRWQDYIAEFGSVIGSGFLWRQLARYLVGLIPVWGIVPKVAVAYSGTFVVGNVILQWYLTGRHITREQMRALYLTAFTRGKATAEVLVKKLTPRKKKKPEALPAGAEPPAAAPLPTGNEPPAELVDRLLEDGELEVVSGEPVSPDGAPSAAGAPPPAAAPVIVEPSAVVDAPAPQPAPAASKPSKPPKQPRQPKPPKEPKPRKPLFAWLHPQKICPACGKKNTAAANFCQFCGQSLP